MRNRLIIFFISVMPFFSAGQDYLVKASQFMAESKYDSAIYCYSEYIRFQKLDGNKELVADVLLKRCHAYELVDSFNLATEGYINAENIYEKQGNFNGLVATYTNFSELYRKRKKLAKATFYLDKASEYIESGSVSSKVLARYYNRKAAVLNEYDGDINEVIVYSKKVISLAKEANDIGLEAIGLNELGFVYEKENNNVCVAYYEEAYELFAKNKDLRNALNVLVNLSRYHVAHEEYLKALDYLNVAFDLSKDHDFASVNIKLYYFEYQALKQLGRFQEANEALSRYYNTDKKIIEIEWNKTLLETESKYDLEIKNKEIEEEKNKSFQLEEESKNKLIQRNYVILISVLLAAILFITILAFVKIKKMNKVLALNLDQKEILIQEVHHRVKNNLTLLKSLLYLRAKASQDDNVIDVLNECQSRVQTMSIVHQNLYDVEDASKVDFRTFLLQLTNEAVTLFVNDNRKIETKIETNGISFEMGSAVFIGLILNELITNSIKYAFEGVEHCEISINVIRKGDKYVLTYADSGIGLPDSFDLKSSGGFGFKLVNIMLNQIDGELKYNKIDNNFTLEFSL